MELNPWSAENPPRKMSGRPVSGFSALLRKKVAELQPHIDYQDRKWKEKLYQQLTEDDELLKEAPEFKDQVRAPQGMTFCRARTKLWKNLLALVKGKYKP